MLDANNEIRDLGIRKAGNNQVLRELTMNSKLLPARIACRFYHW
jgi:hypothetical protein